MIPALKRYQNKFQDQKTRRGADLMTCSGIWATVLYCLQSAAADMDLYCLRKYSNPVLVKVLLEIKLTSTFVQFCDYLK